MLVFANTIEKELDYFKEVKKTAKKDGIDVRYVAVWEDGGGAKENQRWKLYSEVSFVSLWIVLKNVLVKKSNLNLWVTTLSISYPTLITKYANDSFTLIQLISYSFLRDITMFFSPVGFRIFPYSFFFTLNKSYICPPPEDE